MKTITFGTGQSNFGAGILFFICFLSSFNSQSQKIQTSLTETWKNGIWENFTQTINTYDGNGYLMHDLTQNWDVSWKNKLQTDYTNNPDGTTQQSIFQSWNTGANKWDNLQRLTYTYTAAKKVLTLESEMWYDPNWTYFFKQTNTYDGNNYLTNSLVQTYNYIYQWENSSQTIYTNNLDGTVSQSVYRAWNPWGYDVDNWYDVERTTFTYNNSKPVMAISERWNGTIWENFSKDTYGYDGSGYLTNTLSQNWVSNSWKNDSQSLITNYGNGNPFQIVSQDWDDIGLVWKNDLKTTLTYISLGVEENVFEKTFAVYPNPAQDKITIKTNGNSLGLNYLVTDQLGRQFLNGTITDGETVIDIGQLATGVYFIQMGQNKNQTIKMVKK
jgi:hypothetical protein